MILADTSVWVDHLRSGDAELERLLDGGAVLMHPFVMGEIALGHLQKRETILAALVALPQATVASEAEVLAFIDRHRLFGLGIGYVDVHLLAAATLSAAPFWTRDKRLQNVAARLGLAKTA